MCGSNAKNGHFGPKRPIFGLFELITRPKLMTGSCMTPHFEDLNKIFQFLSILKGFEWSDLRKNGLKVLKSLKNAKNGLFSPLNLNISPIFCIKVVQ